jgi:flagellar motor switch protein FliG
MPRGYQKEEFLGRQKAAVLLVALGPDYSAQIFKHLKEDEIEELTLEVANLRSVSSETKEKILDEFFEICLAQQYIYEGGITYARDILEKALGQDKALDILNKLTVSLQVKPFDFVRKADPAQILNFIQNEHPQTVALILAYLKPVQSAAVLAALSTEKQADVARRIAKMDRTSPEIVKQVERVFEKKLSALVNQDYTVVGGLEHIVDILNNVDRGTEKNIMEALEIEDTDLVEEIKKRMFVFEDILLLDDRSVQRFLRECDSKALGLALKMSTDQLKGHIFKNMSKRMAEMIKEDMEFMGPARIKDVEEAQQGIVNTIRKLEEAGDIIISRGGGDELVV